MMARTVVSFAEYERELISERTKAGLAAKKRRGEPIGRPRLAQPGVVRRIVMDRNAGLTSTASPRLEQKASSAQLADQLAELHRAAHLRERHFCLGRRKLAMARIQKRQTRSGTPTYVVKWRTPDVHDALMVGCAPARRRWRTRRR